MDREREDSGENGGEDGGELTAEERTLLLRWQPPGPPEDFAARVLDEPRPSGEAEDRGAGGEAVGAESEARGAATGGAAVGAESEDRGAATGGAAARVGSARRGAATAGAAASGGSARRGAATGGAAARVGSGQRGAAASKGAAGSQRGRAIAWGAGAVVLAAAAAMALSLRSSGAPGKVRGAAAPTFAALRWMKERESIALGGRGIAVAEAGAALGWRRTGDSARVEQEAGDVFYRVDPGGPFTVTTAAGEVRVTGTCFRVEVISMKPSKQGWIGAAAGAALATAVVVTVYEGKVVVASPSGSAQVRAGERATLAPDVPPALATSAPPSVALAELPPAPPNATREELLARDEAMRQQVASLAQRLRQLQTVASAAPSEEPKVRTFDSKESWTDVPAETLLEFARECRVQIDFPPMNAGPFKLSPKLAEQLELSSDEVAAANQTFAELHASWLRRLRALYVETTGDNAGAESLSMQALSEELREKAAGEGEAEALQKRIAEERAGLLPVPTDLSRTSPYERYFRAFANLGEEAEALLASKLGKEKAHAIRATDGGWPMRMGLAGCREGAKGSAPEGP